MSLFTGLYPSRHGVVSTEHALPDETLTFVDLLHQRGYSTAAFTGGGFVRKKFNYHTFDVFEHGNYWATSDQEYNRTFEKMIGWLDQQSGPFFLFWHTYKVHSPYAPAAENDRFADPDYDGPVDTYPDDEAPECPTGAAKGCFWKGREYFDRMLDHMDDHDVQLVIDRYDAEIVEVDAFVGRLMSELRARSLLGRTVVILLSDHGESFRDRLHRQRIGHGDMYEEILQVPLMMRIPGVAPARFDDVLAELVDVMPTLLALLGMDIPDGLDGLDLLTAVPDTSKPDARARSEHVGSDFAAAYLGDYKLIRRGSSFELYDIQSDPRELQNLFGTGLEVEDELRRMTVFSVNPEIPVEEQVLDEDTIEELEALGYL